MIKQCICILYVAALSVFFASAWAHDDGEDSKSNLETGGGGTGGPFSAYNIEFLGQLPLASIGGGSGVRGNDIWGWTDSTTSREYALVGRSNGTAFVDITDPVNPLYLGNLPTQTGNKAWRDIKVYMDHAYIVSDVNGAHGMQVFDLTQLRTVTSPPVTFSNTTHYTGFTSSHNIVINEATGYAYSVGDNTFSGGLHFIDISSPASPVAAGGYSGDGYTHDAQVVIYAGPDIFYQGQEIAFAFNADTLTLVDVTNKASPTLISKAPYTNSAYVHQGWLTENHEYMLSNDELDESNNPAINFTRTHIWDVRDLDNPIHIGYYEAAVQSIDHNLYTHNGLAYEANYTTGLRVLDYSDIANANLTEIAWIDTHPAKDSLTSYDGAWSVYPYFPSGNIVIGDRDEGLVIVRLLEADLSVTGTATPAPVLQGDPLAYDLTVTNSGADDANNVTLTATLPAEVDYLFSVPTQGSCAEVSGTVTCTLGTISNGATADVDITVSTQVEGTPLTDISVSADEPDPTTANNLLSIALNILIVDSDGDGLSDIFEASIGTNPALSDSDGDGLSDFDEVNYDGDSTTYTPGQDTDPLSADTDLDGYNDGQEVSSGSDPLDINSVPAVTAAPLLSVPMLITLLFGLLGVSLIRVRAGIYPSHRHEN